MASPDPIDRTVAEHGIDRRLKRRGRIDGQLNQSELPSGLLDELLGVPLKDRVVVMHVEGSIISGDRSGGQPLHIAAFGRAGGAASREKCCSMHRIGGWFREALAVG